MNAAHLTIAAAIVIPGVLATGYYLIPSEAERQAAAREANRIAAVERQVTEETPQRFVLQPFYVPGGAFIFEIVTRGSNGLSALCGNLPILHDAIITQLDEDSRLFNKQSKTEYKPDAENFRQTINASFGHPFVLRVDVTYLADTSVMLAGRRTVGSATRCATIKKSQRTRSDS